MATTRLETLQASQATSVQAGMQSKWRIAVGCSWAGTQIEQLLKSGFLLYLQPITTIPESANTL